jgi:hypothetical protein
MALTAPTTITALGTSPSTNDPANFDTRADALLAQLPTMVTQQNSNNTAAYANAQYAYDQAVIAAAQASNASASASAAAISAGASIWVSGTIYAISDAVVSPITLETFRRKTAGAGTTDPSLDSANWQNLTPTTPLSQLHAVALSF